MLSRSSKSTGVRLTEPVFRTSLLVMTMPSWFRLPYDTRKGTLPTLPSRLTLLSKVRALRKIWSCQLVLAVPSVATWPGAPLARTKSVNSPADSAS